MEGLEALIQKYKSGVSFDVLKIDENTLKLQGATEEQIKDYKDNLENNLLRKRNEIWVKKLVSASEKNMFVAGGVAHFINSYNVLDGLKKEGFSVKRFNFDCQPE